MKALIIVLLCLVEIWSVTGVTYSLFNKNKEEIIEKVDEETANSKDETSSTIQDEENKFENFVPDVVVDINDNSTSSDEEKNNNNNNINNSNNTEKPSNPQNNQNNTEEEKKEETNNNVVPDVVTLISSENKTEDAVTYKYGVKITTTKTYTVNTYSDGKIEKIEINSGRSTYDKSSYNATTNDLKNEAIILANKNKSIYNEILGYVNEYRSAVAVPSLKLDDNLSVAATIRAMELAYTSDINNISHVRPNGTKFWSVLEDMNIDYSSAGENIAADSGYKTPKSVTDSWKNSKGHYENMIDSGYGKMGVGLVELDGNKYWVQLFTN